MAFTFTWNPTFETVPGDGENIALGASRIRDLKTAISERVKVDHSLVGNDDDGKHNKVTFLAPLGADPAAVIDHGFLYTKDVATKAELHFRDEDGNIAQLTNQGGSPAFSNKNNIFESIDGGASAGPILELYRNSASPAASDFIGSYPLTGQNSAPAKVTYAELLAQIIDPTSTSEDARAIIRAAVAGTLTDILTIGPGVQVGAPTGSDKGPSTLNVQSGMFSNGVRFDYSKGSNIASAGTIDLGAATGPFVHITGTTTISSLGTANAGVWRIARFADILTLVHNATSLILPGAASITTAANDLMLAMSEGGGNWRVFYQRANGAALASIIAQGATITASGANVDVTGITPTAKQIKININGLSSNSTVEFGLRIGHSGGFETTGYGGSSSQGTTQAAYSSEFQFTINSLNSSAWHGTLTLNLQDAPTNTWTYNGQMSTSGLVVVGAGRKSLTGVLDRLQLRQPSGVFDAGTLSIQVLS